MAWSPWKVGDPVWLCHYMCRVVEAGNGKVTVETPHESRWTVDSSRIHRIRPEDLPRLEHFDRLAAKIGRGPLFWSSRDSSSL